MQRGLFSFCVVLVIAMLVMVALAQHNSVEQRDLGEIRKHYAYLNSRLSTAASGNTALVRERELFWGYDRDAQVVEAALVLLRRYAQPCDLFPQGISLYRSVDDLPVTLSPQEKDRAQNASAVTLTKALIPVWVHTSTNVFAKAREEFLGGVRSKDAYVEKAQHPFLGWFALDLAHECGHRLRYYQNGMRWPESEQEEYDSEQFAFRFEQWAAGEFFKARIITQHMYGSRVYAIEQHIRAYDAKLKAFRPVKL